MQKLTSNESKILYMSDEDIIKSFNLILKSNSPVIYKKIITKITGSITSSLLLSQLMYWNNCMKGKEFYKTNDEFCEELCMNINEFKAAKKKLVDKKFISVRSKGYPPKTYYTINVKKIYEALLGENPPNESQIEQNQSTNQSAENQPNDHSVGNPPNEKQMEQNQSTNQSAENQPNDVQSAGNQPPLGWKSATQSVENQPIVHYITENTSENNNTARAYVREEITQPHVGKDHFEKIIEEEKDMQYTDAQIEDEKLTKEAIRFMYDWPDYETNKPVTAKVKASLKIAKTKKDFADLMEYASDYRREFLGNGGNPEFMLRPNTWLDKEGWKKYSASYEALIATKASEPSWKDSAPKPLSYQELAEQEKKRKTTAELDIRGRIVESVTREECNKYFKYNNMWVDLTKDIITLTFAGKNLMREAEEKFSGKIKGLFPNKTIKFIFQGIASQKDENLPAPKDFVGFDREKVKRELEEMRKIREKRVA